MTAGAGKRGATEDRGAAGEHEAVRTAETQDWASLVEELEFLLDSDVVACAGRAVDSAALARRLGDDDAEMRLSCYAASAHLHLGDDAAALAAAERVEHLARERDEPVWQSRAIACRGLVHYGIGNVEDAVDLLRWSVELCREAKDAPATAEALNSLGTVYIGLVHLAPEAAQALTDARRLWLTAGDTDRAAIALTGLARTYVLTSARLAETNPRGALTAARHALGIARQAVEEADAAGLSRPGIDARLAVVGAHMVAGELEAAGAALDAALAMLDRFPTPQQHLAVHCVRSRWLVACARHDDAVLEVCDGLDLCDELDRPGERAELLRALVQAHEGRGDVAAALGALHDLHDLTVQQSEAIAERRSVLLSSRLELERAERMAEAERRRAVALEQHNARLAYEAMHDALTGLANRRALDSALAAWVGDPDRRFAVALIDVDHFKRVNDRWSHPVGDQVLARLGTTLRDTVRAGDLAARYGGEEFGILLDGVGPDTALEACERIRTAVAALDWDELMPGARITVSIGVTVGTTTSDPPGLLAAADAALYEAKASGRDRVRLAPVAVGIL